MAASQGLLRSELRDTAVVDAYRRLYPTDPGYTFPAAAPHVRLDYVFAPALPGGPEAAEVGASAVAVAVVAGA